MAERFGYSPSTVYTLARNFRRLDDPGRHFFATRLKPGRPASELPAAQRQRIVELRETRLSVPDIQARLHAEHDPAPSLRSIWRVLREAGFERLPRRTQAERARATDPPLTAPASRLLAPRAAETFVSERAAGTLCLLPWIRAYGIDTAIEQAGYPGTSTQPALQSVLAFVALKLSDFRNCSTDDLWCMDRGLGLFAGLNVLPKAATLAAYSDRTTRPMHQALFGSLAAIWQEKGLLGDTANLDRVTLPHWGDDATPRKHWSGTGGRSLLSLSADLAQDPASGLVLRSDAGGRDASGPDAVLQFLAFSRESHLPVRYLVFDSRHATYASLDRLDDAGIRFVTVRRRGKALLARAQALDPASLRQVRVPTATGTRLLSVHAETVRLRTYGGSVRQIAILRGARRRPSFLITNDLSASLSDIARLYARRWLAEQSISEQLSFFHLNRISSSMAIRADFDLAMTVLAYNLLRLLASHLPPGCRALTPRSLYERCLAGSAQITLSTQRCEVALKDKRDLPALLEAVQSVGTHAIPWLGDRELRFSAAATS